MLASTLGLVFAAFLDSRMTADLIRSELAMTNGPAAWAGLKRISDVDALLTKVRRNGLATSAKSVIAPGVASIAISVFQYEDWLAAVLAVAGRPGQLDLSVSGKPARALARKCRDLSMRLGAR